MRLGDILEIIDSRDTFITIYDGNLNFGRHLVTYKGCSTQLSEECRNMDVLKVYHKSNGLTITTQHSSNK